jgi:hypothetical protein
MRTTTICSAIGAGLLAVSCASAPASPTPVSAPAASAPAALTAADVIARVVESFGGPAAVDGIDTIEMQGNSRRTAPGGQEWSMLLTSYIDFPDRYRQEVLIPQARITTILDGEKAFLHTDVAGTIEMPTAERLNMLAGLRRNPIALLQRRGSMLATLEAPEVIDGTPVVVVRLDEELGTTRLVADSQSGELRQIRYATARGDGKTQEMIISYGNFRKVGDLRFPFRSQGLLGGNHAFTTDLDGMTINPRLPDHLFAPPPPAAAPPQPGPVPKP